MLELSKKLNASWVWLLTGAALALCLTACRQPAPSVSCSSLTRQRYAIMGQGSVSKPRMQRFLIQHNSKLSPHFANKLADLYIQEAKQEGVNHDIAFCQMCHETDFLRYGNQVKVSQNNFAGLGATDDGARGASFSSPQLGIRAQIQHLKAYASKRPLANPLVDPRFQYVQRGSAPTIFDLSKRWATDPLYGQKLKDKLAQLTSQR